MPQIPIGDDCPDAEDIAAFVQGLLAPSRVRSLEAHVGHCPACRQLLSAVAQVADIDSLLAAHSASPTLPLEYGATETELQIGARFGRYDVLDWLGAGGMGAVYSAYDPELNRKIALKVLGNDGASPGDRAPIHDLLLREAQAMAQLAHPNVVTVFDVGSVDGRVFIAMELVQGVTLRQWLAAEHRAHGEIIATFLAAGSGLAAAHAAGLIHRDFKPDNVLIGNDGRVRVTDFGLARAAPRAPFEAAHPGLTEPGHGTGTRHSGLVGTLAYMAPEQYFGRSVDARADQFSFAVALHEALHGERPLAPWLSGGDQAARHHAVMASRGGGVPVRLRQVLSRALSVRPDERYSSMDELLAALAPRSRRGRLIGVGALLVVAAAVTSAAGYALHLRHAAEQRIELVGRLRALAPELRTRLRSAHMLPLHDIRSARDEVRSAMNDVEHQLQTPAGQDEVALINFVLGEGYRTLGDNEHALTLLEAASAAGEHGPHMDAALGDALGVAYESRLNQIEHMVQSSRRDAEIRSIEARYRDPAMVRLRAALVAKAGSPAYLEALAAFHDRRFAESSRAAHAAFVASPTFYEAGMLEARARHATGRELLAAGSSDEANTEFAAARQIFGRVLEIARSDDDAWLAYGEMVLAQVVALKLGDVQGDMQTDLQQGVLTALRTARQINPDKWEAFLREAEVYEREANVAINWYRDPGPHADKVVALANEARVHGADSDQVDNLVCLVQWERAVYQGAHGVDPHAALEQALAACERAAATKLDADNYASLGTVYASLAAYDAEHGGDPTRAVELSERNLRAAIAIDDNAGLHYNLGRLWTKLAHFHASHGRSPQHAVDSALAELETTVRMDAGRGDAWAAISDALIARARFLRAQREDAQATMAQAHTAIERALAIEAKLLPPIRYRMNLAELEAEALLEHHADPTGAVERMRSDAQLLLRRLPDDGFAHRLRSTAELVAARWALAQREAVDDLLARAAAEAARAHEVDPKDVLAWTASAEVEQLRAEAARARGSAPGAAVASGLAFIATAMAIDPRLVRTRKVRDELARLANPMSSPSTPHEAAGR
jgi:tetratricopeptide (TPR) repeat protein